MGEKSICSYDVLMSSLYEKNMNNIKLEAFLTYTTRKIDYTTVISLVLSNVFL